MGSMFLLPNYNNYDSFIAVIDSRARSHKVSPTSSRVWCWTWQVKVIFNMHCCLLTVRKVSAPSIWWLDKSGPFLQFGAVNGILICCIECGRHRRGTHANLAQPFSSLRLYLALMGNQWKVFKKKKKSSCKITSACSRYTHTHAHTLWQKETFLHLHFRRLADTLQRDSQWGSKS